jgi:hypothetical protein
MWEWRGILVILYLLHWLSNDPRLPLVLQGWCKLWKINRRQKEFKEENPTQKNQTWASQEYNKSTRKNHWHTSSLWVWEHSSTVPLMQARAKVSSYRYCINYLYLRTCHLLAAIFSIETVNFWHECNFSENRCLVVSIQPLSNHLQCL